MTTNAPALVVPDPTLASTNAVPNELNDIRPMVDIVSPWEYVLWGLGLVAGLVLAYFLVRYFLRKQAEKQVAASVRSSLPAHLIARQQLDAALEHLHDTRYFCILVSDAVRRYLEARFSLRAPEQTTEEFLHELQQTPTLNLTQKQALEDFLGQCDMAKFAKAEMVGNELKVLHETALQFVQQTEPREVHAPGAQVGASELTDRDQERGQQV